jgi:SpoVK/Ycf46/Vps4 family AAA+-type ATPase
MRTHLLPSINRIEVITVLTTNHVERITLAMLRPGRLDTVVSVRAPDAEAALRLVKMYAGDILDPSCDFNQSNVGDSLAGQIPALIREVVERSKLAALRRSGDQLLLTPNDIEVTALSMKNHMNLLKNPEPDERSTEELAAATIANGLIRSAEIRAQASSETHSFVNSGDNHKGIAATG